MFHVKHLKMRNIYELLTIFAHILYQNCTLFVIIENYFKNILKTSSKNEIIKKNTNKTI